MTYVADREVMKTPTSKNVDPSTKVGLNRPASELLPETVPIKKRRKICTEPIQEMSEGGRLRALT